jgi:hypothetical protein
LSQLFQKLFQDLPQLDFSDQFGFRPTGSTTAAVITLLHTVTDMLTSNAYVRVIALDFSKAFDTVRHVTLFNKLSKIDVPDEIYNWMRNGYDGRTDRRTALPSMERYQNPSKFCHLLFRAQLSVQPRMYVVTAADLKTLHSGNKLLKYADDTYLVIPAVNTITVQDELNQITEWSRANNLRLNHAKTQEIIFVRKRAPQKHTVIPDVIPGITRVQSLKVLGVFVSDHLSASEHVTEIIAACCCSLYALKILKAHGLTGQAIHTVFKATVQAKLLYCAPAWSGFCSAADRDRLDSFFNRCKKL